MAEHFIVTIREERDRERKREGERARNRVEAARKVAMCLELCLQYLCLTSISILSTHHIINECRLQLIRVTYYTLTLTLTYTTHTYYYLYAIILHSNATVASRNCPHGCEYYTSSILWKQLVTGLINKLVKCIYAMLCASSSDMQMCRIRHHLQMCAWPSMGMPVFLRVFIFYVFVRYEASTLCLGINRINSLWLA